MLTPFMLRGIWHILGGSRSEDSDQLKPISSPTSIDIKRLAAASYLTYLPRIQYVYDPLPALPIQNSYPCYVLPSGASATNEHASRNSIELDPFSARLPYRSSINHVRASKYWKANLEETLRLLELLATDNSAADIEVDHGVTLARLAKKAIQPGREHQMVLATEYMFPNADERRIRQIATMMIIYFVFDDKVEETPNDSLRMFRDDFLRRLDTRREPSCESSALQRHINDIIRGMGTEDTAGGDGGKEMLDALRTAFRYVHPETRFQSVDEYLEFRRKNVGATFVIAAAKFSIKSSVSLTDPRFSRYLKLIGDHLGVVNDLASYDKELRALNQGETSDMINVVHVVKSVTSLQGTDDAKAIVWTLQLQIEKQMIEELEDLRKGEGLTNDEWWFLDAVTSTTSGNVMFCMTSSRYGGDAARI